MNYDNLTDETKVKILDYLVECGLLSDADVTATMDILNIPQTEDG